MSARRTTTGIVLHCAFTPAKMDVGVAEITRWHKERGFRTIGYHWVIRRDGTVEAGRPEREIGAHCLAQGMNSVSIGICLVGGMERGKPANNFLPEQFTACAKLIADIRRRYRAILRVTGHNDHEPGRACPNFDVPAFLAAHKLANPVPPKGARAAALRPVGGEDE
jgi:N-acetyl-anhydromuramyl-L-alanine amidase AmpD